LPPSAFFDDPAAWGSVFMQTLWVRGDKDRARAYAEVRRVLRPGGRFYAATNGAAHMREFDALIRDAGTPPNVTRTIGFRLENGEQTMLLLNRRGFSSSVACRACGERVGCVNCSLTLTYHRRDRRMLCHYCNYAEKVPSRCPKCQSEHIYFLGVGSEKVEEELHRELPKARISGRSSRRRRPSCSSARPRSSRSPRIPTARR